MPKEVVTPQVIANWFANKRKENRRKSHDETGSSFNSASLSLGLATPGTFNLQNASQHHQAPPSSAPSALAFQLSNVATAGNIFDSLQQSSFQHQVKIKIIFYIIKKNFRIFLEIYLHQFLPLIQLQLLHLIVHHSFFRHLFLLQKIQAQIMMIINYRAVCLMLAYQQMQIKVAL